MKPISTISQDSFNISIDAIHDTSYSARKYNRKYHYLTCDLPNDTINLCDNKDPEKCLGDTTGITGYLDQHFGDILHGEDKKFALLGIAIDNGRLVFRLDRPSGRFLLPIGIQMCEEIVFTDVQLKFTATRRDSNDIVLATYAFEYDKDSFKLTINDFSCPWDAGVRKIIFPPKQYAPAKPFK